MKLMMRCINRVTPLLFVLTLILPGLSSAADEMPLTARMNEPGYLRIGPLDVHPYLSLKEEYNDNILYTPDNKESDFINTVAPGIFLQLPFGGHTISLDANTAITSYADHNSQNTTDYSITGKANFMLGGNINLKLSESYVKSHENAWISASGEIEKYRSNVAAASLTYLLAELSKLQVDYTRTVWDFATENFRNRHEDLVSLYVYYRILPKTFAFLEYDFENVNFDSNTDGLDNKVNSGLLGLTWEYSEKSKGTVKAGYLVKDFTTANQQGINTWTMSADISHAFSDYNSLRLVAARTVNESSLQGTSYSITTGLYTEFTHRFLDRLAGVVSAAYGIDKFSNIVSPETELRKDHTLYAGLGARYAFRRWMNINLDYMYRNRNSTIDADDFTVNSLMLSMGFAF